MGLWNGVRFIGRIELEIENTYMYSDQLEDQYRHPEPPLEADARRQVSA